MEELKFQLQNELQKEGVVENMKTQLRYKLLERLQLQQKKPIDPQIQPALSTSTLPKRVVASLIADHLQKTNLTYCLSVFTPESGFGGQFLSNSELSVLLKTDSLNQLSIIESIISDILLVKPREVQRYNASTQTSTGDSIQNLEQKLQNVDQAFRQKMEGELLKPHIDMEERMLKWKKEYDSRWKIELQAELTRVREFEVQQIRLEENEKQRKKMQDYREELEKNYQDKLNKLRDRERDSLEKSTMKMKELESLNYNYRQKITREHEMLRLKEQEIQKQQELNEEKIRLQQQKVEQKERELTIRLNDLKKEQEGYEKKYTNDINMNKLSLENDVNEEREQLRLKQKKIDQDFSKIEQLKQTIETLNKENRQLVSENEKYVEQIRDLKKKKRDIENELQQVKDQLRTISDLSRRDQELARKYENDLKFKEEEVNLHKHSLQHKESMINDHKSLHSEAIKKLNREIQGYQERIQKQEILIKEYQEEIIKREQMIIKPQAQIIDQPTSLISGNILTSILMGQNQHDHISRLKQIHSEMEENRIKRQEEIRRLQEDPMITSIPGNQLKFDKVWDPHNSQIDYSQGPSVYRKANESYQNEQVNVFKLADDASSQVFQSNVFQKRNNQNIIEETYEELM